MPAVILGFLVALPLVAAAWPIVIPAAIVIGWPFANRRRRLSGRR